MEIRKCLSLAPLVVVSISLASAKNEEGIRCASTHGRVNVTPKQWKIVRDALLSHDIKRITPFISENGITETSTHNDSLTHKPNMVAFCDIVSKETFLRNVTSIKYHDSTGVISPNDPGQKSDLVFGYFWCSLVTTVVGNGRATLVRRATSIHHRADVWVSKNAGGEGRVRFVSEDGWLKIAEIKTPIGPDAGFGTLPDWYQYE